MASPILDLSRLQDAVHRALRDWDQPSDEADIFVDLIIYQQMYEQDSLSSRRAVNKVITSVLETLKSETEEYAQLLSRRFLDGEKMMIIANSLNISESTAYRIQKEAIERLTQLLHDQEIEAHQARQTILESRLERSTYTQLIGIEEHLDTIINLLIASKAPWLISIEGLGGIGKTSLADAISRRVISHHHFANFGWVSARPQNFRLTGEIEPTTLFPVLQADMLVDHLIAQLIPHLSQSKTMSPTEAQQKLRTQLKEIPHLIVIDNLETIADITELLPLLRDFANPTKFLLTSRESLYEEQGTYHFLLPELNEANALRLIRYEAQLHNSPYLQTANDDALKRIYTTVGGNPLAIRLVVGQTHLYSLDVILSDLETSEGHSTENLYTFIYRRAWDKLDESARRVLLALPLIATGEGTLEHIQELSEVDSSELRKALSWLIRLNLIDSHPGLTEQTYTIHNLTRTFLHEQVLRWKGDGI